MSLTNLFCLLFSIFASAAVISFWFRRPKAPFVAPPCSLELEYRRQAAEKAQHESLRLDSSNMSGNRVVQLTFVGASAEAFHEAVKLYYGHKVRIILEPVE